MVFSCSLYEHHSETGLWIHYQRSFRAWVANTLRDGIKKLDTRVDKRCSVIAEVKDLCEEARDLVWRSAVYRLQGACVCADASDMPR